MTPILLEPPVSKLTQADASTEVFLPGSETALRTGLECVFQYNGLRMNDRMQIDTYVITRITGLDDADIRADSELVAGDHGEFPLDSYYGGRTITFTGYIRAGNVSKLRDLQEALQRAFVDLSEKPLYVFTGQPGRNWYINCRKNQPIAMVEEQTNFEYRREFLITLRASNPRKFITQRRLYQDTELPTNAFSSRHVFTAINGGSMPAQPVIRIGGGLVNPSFYNEQNGDEFTIATTIPDDEFWEFDAARRTLRSNAGENKFRHFEGDYMSYEQMAENPIIMSAEPGGSGAPYVVSYHRDTYI